MKYLTKEWYDITQRAALNTMYKTSKKAETFSEEYFEMLYKREEKKWLKLQKEVSELTFDDIYPEEFYIEEDDDFPLDGVELEEAKKAYFEEREAARADFEEAPPFDPELEKENFRAFNQSTVDELKEYLPEEILRKVADIRVLALGYATAEVKRDIKEYRKKQLSIVTSAMKEYEKEYKRQFRSGSPSFAEELELHDCLVVSCRKKGKNVVMTLDNSSGFTDIREVKFKNCTVIKQDARLRGAWMLYKEIYKAGKRYEIHLLLQKDEQLIDYIVEADDVELKHG